ncbi:MAG: RsmD family RNA methyltransferase [Muribaculaceae bacterium]|nr:RsmD family RNA methyltransferase [Muribaculaceae bacterium]
MKLSEDFYSWIAEHSSDDPARLRLKFGRDRAFEILQIDCRRKYASKLADSLAADPEFIFPTALSGEQTTSDRLASYHAGMVPDGASVIDLTAGLGIDAMSMARHGAAAVVAVERDPEVADALRHNSRGLENFEVIEGDCRDVIKDLITQGRKFDYAFIDPARRAGDGSRVFALGDCEPDVTAMLPELRSLAGNLIVKASPMLDITDTVDRLPGTTEVTTLGTTTECKELDIRVDLDSDTTAGYIIKAVTLGDGLMSEFMFTRAEEAAATVMFGEPRVGDTVYEPFPAVMKAAPFKLLGERFCLKKAGPNTHMWFSDTEAPDFPGRALRVIEVLPYMSKHIKRYASRYPKAGVTTRNFDTGADALRTKLGVKDGPLRLFAITAFNSRKLLVTCEPVTL